MNSVEPIRDIDIVNDIFEYLYEKNKRDSLMFAIGIYTALRISDILLLRVRDVKGKEYIKMREKKTGKEKIFVINEQLKSLINEYINGMKDYEYLIKSPRGYNNPLTRQQAYNIIRNAALLFGVENVGTHTMRKTFGYHYYQQTKDAALLMDIFGHSDISITLRYIGVNQDRKNTAYHSMGKLINIH